MPESSLPIKTAPGIAYRGQSVDLEQFDDITPLPKVADVTRSSSFSTYVPSTDIDFTDLAQLNAQFQSLIVRMHSIRIELDKARRVAAKAKYEYNHEKRLVLAGLSGSSTDNRDAIAELMVEGLYTKMMVADSVAAEIQEHSRVIPRELDALQAISNNLRRQIDIK